jgi:hypothetical protein
MKKTPWLAVLVTSSCFLVFSALPVDGEEEPPPPTPTYTPTFTPTYTPTFTPLPTPEAIWQAQTPAPLPTYDADEIVEGNGFRVHWGNNIEAGGYSLFRRLDPSPNWTLVGFGTYVAPDGPDPQYYYVDEPGTLDPGQYFYRVHPFLGTSERSDEGSEPPVWKGGIHVVTPTPTPLPKPDEVFQSTENEDHVKPTQDIDILPVPTPYWVYFTDVPDDLEEYYKVFQKKDSGSWTEIHPTLTRRGPWVSGYSFPGPESPGHYVFKISSPGASANDELSDEGAEPPVWKGGIHMVTPTPTPCCWDDNGLENADSSYLGKSIDDQAGYSLSGAGDVNRDGYADFLVGAPFDDNNGTDSGTVYLVLGTGGALSLDQDIESVAAAWYVGESAGDGLGLSVAGVGDVNNDGFDDFMMGAPYHDHGASSNTGKAYLVFGAKTGWATNENVAIGSNASFVGEGAEDNAGWRVAGIGDVNGDGVSDIALGAPNDDDGGNGAGQGYVFFGKSMGWTTNTDLATADVSFIGEATEDHAGEVIAGAGDANGDGYDDVLISSPAADYGGSGDVGKAYLIFGATTEWATRTSLSNADASWIGEGVSDYAGFSLSGGGDFNNDGYDDVVIGAYSNDEGGTDSGQVYLVYGAETGWATNISLGSADASFIGYVAGDNAGWSVAMGGDWNMDGFDDLLIGASLNASAGTEAGRVYLFYGSEAGWPMDTIVCGADKCFTGEDASDKAGYSLSWIGDFNGDLGPGDLIIGAVTGGTGSDEYGESYYLAGVTPTPTPTPGPADFEVGKIEVVDGTWKQVTLINDYLTPVVVCSVNYNNNTVPVVPRVRNAKGRHFEVMLQNPGGEDQGGVVGDDVYYMVAEQGRWELPDGGILEAKRIESDQVASNRDCVGQGADCGWETSLMEEYLYENPYTNVAVFGQVMSYYDERWSVFVSMSGDETASLDPPTPSSCFVGKAIEESPAPGTIPKNRLTEILGVIVIEAATVTQAGNRYQVFCGDSTIKGVTDENPSYYPLTAFTTTPQIAVVTQAGMQGKEGSWAYLNGPTPLTSSQVQLAVDEDRVHDSERGYLSQESVSVAVFESEGSFDLSIAPIPTPTPWQSIQSPTPLIQRFRFVGDEDSDGGADVDAK